MSITLSTGLPAGAALAAPAVLAGLLALQAALSRVKSRWPGLLLPALALVRAVADATEALAPSLLSAAGGTLAVSPAPPSLPQALGTALTLFVIRNIPTAVCLAVYALCRSRRAKRLRELERMDVQDL